ncbi:MAG: ABC transporter ATP-binding protein [Spirochaetia bacterium]|nr:ABC transporter ATP-binding protein [Spirochaetia bacterium]
MADVILDIQNAVKRFGGLTAVNRVSTAIRRGEIRALIGPNGSGKTTLLNVISGIYAPEEGAILFEGAPIQGLFPYGVAWRGISRTFQNIRLFGNLSVIKNVMIGAHIQGKAGILQAILFPKHTREEEQKLRNKAESCLGFVGLEIDTAVKAASLSYGQRRLLEVARALASDPRLILLDETAAGLNPQEKRHLIDIIRKIRDKGITVLFVEHDMGVVMSVSDRITVLNFGSKIAEGTPDEIKTNQLVLEAYLGKENYAEVE